MRMLLFATLVLLGNCAKKPQPPPNTIVVTMGDAQVYAEVAATPVQREQGLMFRKTMPEDVGMLFVFPRAEPLSFWMKNTYIPLSIAFIDSEGVILNIEDMAPLDEQSRARSLGAAVYALEVNQGWFEANGVEAGQRVDFELPDGVVAR